jgi:CheY-like chemotaxis protein
MSARVRPRTSSRTARRWWTIFKAQAGTEIGSNIRLPDLLLTDLKMPRMGGFRCVLRWMREHPEHAATPTIVLSASGLPQDIKRAYELGANGLYGQADDIAGN